MTSGKIKIIHIISNLESGGGQRHLLDIITHASSNKFHHKIIVLKHAGLLEKDFRDKNIELFILGQKTKASLSLIYRVYKILKREKPDIVLTNFFGGHFYGRIAAKLAGNIKIIGLEDVVHRHESTLKIKIKRFVLDPLADRIIACSQEVKDWIMTHEKVPARKIEVIYYGIDLDRFRPKNNITDNLKEQTESIIGTVAIPKKQKGLRYLIEAFGDIHKKFPDTKLWLIGGARQNLPDNEENDLKELAHNLNLEEKITFWGDRKDVPELLAKMDIFVLPSLFEGFGIVILEAWATRLPIVASRLSCIEEYATDQKNILFANPGDSNDLKDKLSLIIGDNSLRKKLAANGQETVQNFAIRKITQKYEAVFINVLK